jgi:hypothetical protein
LPHDAQKVELAGDLAPQLVQKMVPWLGLSVMSRLLDAEPVWARAGAGSRACSTPAVHRV